MSLHPLVLRDDSKAIRSIKVEQGGQVIFILKRFLLADVALLVSVMIAEKIPRVAPASECQDSFRFHRQE
jgi:hypothetical protein